MDRITLTMKMAQIRASLRPLRKISRLDLGTMISEPLRYDGLREGLASLPLPELLTIRGKKLTIPTNLNDFCDNVTYGQKIFFQRPEENEYGIVLRFISGYFYPLFSGKEWDENRALKFGSFVLRSKVLEVYPVALHLVTLMGQLAEREVKLLERKPTSEERQAGIDKLSLFSDLSSILFLQESFRCSWDEVLGKPYNDCLVRFMYQKEQNAYAERLSEIYRKQQSKK